LEKQIPHPAQNAGIRDDMHRLGGCVELDVAGLEFGGDEFGLAQRQGNDR
jgi:hypothetical protein